MLCSGDWVRGREAALRSRGAQIEGIVVCLFKYCARKSVGGVPQEGTEAAPPAPDVDKRTDARTLVTPQTRGRAGTAMGDAGNRFYGYQRHASSNQPF